MTEPVYLFTADGLAALRNFIDSRTLFSFDLDGTLAPITDKPDDIKLSDDIFGELTKLNKLAPVAVITGRSRSDARLHLGFSPQYLIGNHGAEGLPGRQAEEADFIRISNLWESQLNSMLASENIPGIIIENKGATISVHYRGNHDIEKYHSVLLAFIEKLVPHPRIVSGKCIENLLPEKAPDKGVAMLNLIQYAGCSKGLFAGDDETDESVFSHSGENLLTVRVGTEVKTKARFFLKNQVEIFRLLQEINNSLR
jgi:trehalose 6-phosphate phosphatase